MKYFSSNISELLLKISNNKIKALLIHGINNGFADTVIKQIVSKKNLLVSEFNIQDISASKMLMIANNQNFFQQQELIKVTGVKGGMYPDFKKCIRNNDFIHFICFVSNEPLPLNGIRNFFESENDLASIGCYYENEKTIEKLVLRQCQKYHKTITSDVWMYLISYLKGDNNIIKSELNKIFQFTHDRTEITKDDIELSLSGDLLTSSDEMCIALAKKKPEQFLLEVNKLKLTNTSEILMIRALIRYYMNIYMVSKQVEDNLSVDTAIKSVSSAIFFKYVSDFRDVVSRYLVSDVIRVIKILHKCEIEYKKNPYVYDMFSLYWAIHHS